MVAPNATYQQTKMAVDPVAGTYQTVLTIDSSVGQSGFAGLYYCTVENARGGSSMTVVIPGNGELIPYMYCLLGKQTVHYYSQLILEIQLHCHNI